MANTATTATVIDQTTDAAFRTWVAEIITALGTTLTLTQTADTGQINTTTVTRAAVTNTAAGYTIWRFNDTLQATSPIFIKLEFGTGATQPTTPQMWITVGTGSNGAGTLTGVVGARSAVAVGNAPASTTTSYTSRFVYNATYGFLAMAWKLNGFGTATATMGGFIVFRSNDATGAATGDAVSMITNVINSTAGQSSSTGQMQCLSYLTSTLYPPTISNGIYWTPYATAAAPFGLTSTAYSGNAQTFPALYMTPVISFSNYLTVGRASEEPIGSTFSETVIGSTALTYLSVGQMFGSSYVGSFSDSGQTVNILWQ
jgi:hypothetical protein